MDKEGRQWSVTYKKRNTLLIKIHLDKDTFRLKIKGWKKLSHANRNQKRAEVALLISDKNRVQQKTVGRY